MSEKRLNDSQIKRASARATQYTMNDGGGLFVLVLSTGAKYFQLDIRTRSASARFTWAYGPRFHLRTHASNYPSIASG
jgi:hypothetical protein